MVLLGERGAVDDDLAARGLLQVVDATDERGLARAGRPDDDELFALLDREVDILENVQVAKVLIQAPNLDHIGHALLLMPIKQVSVIPYLPSYMQFFGFQNHFNIVSIERTGSRVRGPGRRLPWSDS